MKNFVKQNRKGFTIVELMIATAIFSTILLLCTFGLLRIGRTYYKGVSLVRTQNTSRDVMDTISQSIQFGITEPVGSGSAPDVINNSNGVFCIGKQRYSVAFNQAVGGDKHALVVDDRTTTSCSPQDMTGGSALTPGSKELLGKNMRLTGFKITKTGEDYDIFLKITYAIDDDQYETSGPNFGNCKNIANNQYCAASTLQTTVHRRVSGS